ncbi:hypothetical protein AG0111_0g9556 [Alternaria gaisen]|uniref:Uncharacterized protein n=1 Tax=Alternaria gaisen TaxID=167740 RepID=A0ACB6FC14_9PLEO|nr:hypothetical protein AG0111_0g9556 [Alternaria gaisen]
MAVPFGFSAGDFMAAIHLVHKISTALRETDGASSQYNQTIGQLQGLEELLRSVQSAYSADVDSQQLKKLQLLGHQCYIPLNKFFSKIKTLEPSLGNLSTKNVLILDRATRAARKAQWAVQIKKELAELTAAMGSWINAINMQLLLINFERQEKAGSSLEALLRTSKDLSSQMNIIQTSLDTRLKCPATTTTMDNVVQALRDMRLEAANDRNAQMDTHMGRFDASLSQQVLESIKLLDSKIEDHLAWPRARTVLGTATPNPVSRPFLSAQSGSSHQDQSAIQRIEDQLAVQTHILQQLTERNPNFRSPDSLPGMNSNGVIRSARDTIRKSFQVLLNFFRASVNALLLELCIALSVIQHAFRTLRALPLLIYIPISDSIMFEDALGRIAHLPYVHFRHHTVFMARLRCEFKNVPGEKKVLLKQFRIFRRKRFDEYLTEDNWDTAVSPGSKIAMSILLDSHGSEGNTCPRCRHLKADMNMEDLSQCTFCGLSWVLQKPNSPRRLSSPGRVLESIWSPPVVQNMFEMTEDESSDSLASSPDRSEAVSTLDDDDDIESFKMVHFQPQDTSADAKLASSISSILERAFPSRNIHRPFHYRNHTVSEDLMDVLKSPGTPKRAYVYFCWHEGCSKLLRVGYSTKDKHGQLWMLRRHCKERFYFDSQLYNGRQMEVPFAGQVRELIKTELRNCCVRMECKGCNVAYHEWFYVSKKHGMKVFQKWKDWISREPYMQTDDGTWKLKPSFLAQAKEMSQPLVMKG